MHRGKRRGDGDDGDERASGRIAIDSLFPSLKTQRRQTGRRPRAHRHLGVGRRVQTDRKADHGEEWK